MLAGLGIFGGISNPWVRSIISTGLIQIVIMTLLPFLLYMLFFRKKPKEILSETGFKKVSYKTVLISIGIGILLFLVNLAIATFFSAILSLFGYSSPVISDSASSGMEINNFWLLILEIVIVSVAPAICEEFMHRGVLLKNVAASKGYKYAIIISSLMFGFMHLNIEQFFYASILGLVIGFVASISESIYPAMILHFINNFLNVYFSYAKGKNLIGSNFYDVVNSIISSGSVLFSLISVTLILILLIVGMGYLIVALFKETRVKKINKAIINVQRELIDETKEVNSKQLMENFQEYILPHIENTYKEKSVLFPINEEANPKQNRSFTTNIFLYASIILGIIITLFTFFWGIV